MEDFVVNPPPWVDKEAWRKGEYALVPVEYTKSKTLCNWCGKPTFKTHRGKKRKITMCVKCRVKLREVYTKARRRYDKNIQKCRGCNGFTNRFYQNKVRTPYCSDCKRKGIM